MNHEPKHYPINSLLSMTEIPEESFHRFCDELPAIIREMRRAKRTAFDKIMAVEKPRKLWWVPERYFRRALARAYAGAAFSGVWVDDHKDEYKVGFDVAGYVSEETGKLNG
jgi:hypothetical protein